MYIDVDSCVPKPDAGSASTTTASTQTLSTPRNLILIVSPCLCSEPPGGKARPLQAEILGGDERKCKCPQETARGGSWPPLAHSLQLLLAVDRGDQRDDQDRDDVRDLDHRVDRRAGSVLVRVADR